MKAAFIERPGLPESICLGEVERPSSATLVRCWLKLWQSPSIRSTPTFAAVLTRSRCPGHSLSAATWWGRSTRWKQGLCSLRPARNVWSNNQGYGGRQGTFAEFVNVDEELLHSLPDGVNEQEAVAVVHSALTACLGLMRQAGFKPGETLFINGAVRAGSDPRCYRLPATSVHG
jgi:NADPH:quinone reductase